MTFFDRLRQFLNARLQPQYMQVIAEAIVVFTLVLAVVQFATEKQGQTVFGVPLGADFSGFYVAAQILNLGEPEQLYDRKLHHQLYHELLPHEDERTSIPYVHPPFVAGLFRPFAWFPYPVAFAAWLVISLVLVITSIALLCRVLPGEMSQHRGLILLLGVSFEPFAMECWLGGQLSAIGFFSYALCFVALQHSRPLLAGIALGLCFYKPTLLILTLPMLVIGGRWKTLSGMAITGIILVIVSLLLVGWNVSMGYASELMTFSKSTSGGDLEIRTWKYVDLNNCLRLLLGTGSPYQRPLLLVFGGVPFAFLARLWWLSEKYDDEFQKLLWATTLSWIPVLNLYVGVYDSILIVQSAMITAGAVCRQSQALTPLTNSGLAYLLLAIYTSPWFSQNLAKATGIPLYTLLLIALGTLQIRYLYRFEMKRAECPATAQ